MTCACQPLGRRALQEETTTSPGVVLALPETGAYAAVASRIKTGANAAVTEMKGKGINTQLLLIDTSKSDWLQRLAALPESYAVVGGPLGEANYTAARKAGLMANRMFFSFMPTLAKGEEGKIAWRFFPSPQDQIDALVDCAVNQLNIRSFGAFYPDDAYGRRMTAVLEHTLNQRHMPLSKAAYQVNAPGTWSTAVKPLINPELAENGRTSLPRTTFEALLVPDSWKRMDAVSSSLLANGEDRLVLLGTTLWEQGMKGKSKGKVALGIFPMAWNSSKLPASLKNSGDFWTALGYDFTKFASSLGLARKLDSGVAALNRMQQASSSISVLAPIKWDNDGIGHQGLYIYQVGQGGIAPFNAGNFQQNRRAVAERAALRFQGVSDSGANSEEVIPQAPQVSQPAQPSSAPVFSAPMRSSPAPRSLPAASSGVAPTIESVPHTSYKLSLPVKR